MPRMTVECHVMVVVVLVGAVCSFPSNVRTETRIVAQLQQGIGQNRRGRGYTARPYRFPDEGWELSSNRGRHVPLSRLKALSDNATGEEHSWNRSQQVLDSFVERTLDALKLHTFQSFRIRYHGGGSESKRQPQAEKTIKTISGRLVFLNGKKPKQKVPRVQATYKYHGTTDIVSNWKVSDVEHALRSMFRTQQQDTNLHNLRSAHLHFVDGSTWQLNFTSNGRSASRLLRTTTKTTKTSDVQTAVSTDHDLPKNVLLPPASNPFLYKLGLVTADGKPRPAMSSKLKQCQRFVEIVDSLLPNPVATTATIRTVDMGCGRGYLTFALHAHLLNKYNGCCSNGTIKIETQGVEMRPHLVHQVNSIAHESGFSPFLSFLEGTIQQSLITTPTTMDANDEENKSLVSILVALHACDTATDDALWFGIQNNANIIVVAPCCHREIRNQLDSYLVHTKRKHRHVLEDVLRHNHYRERIAELLTDSLRALLLELVGYHVKVFEFVSNDHTSKNVMITATKFHTTPLPKEDTITIRERIQTLASHHGITTQTLATWMKERLSVDRKE